MTAHSVDDQAMVENPALSQLEEYVGMGVQPMSALRLDSVRQLMAKLPEEQREVVNARAQELEEARSKLREIPTLKAVEGEKERDAERSPALPEEDQRPDREADPEGWAAWCRARHEAGTSWDKLAKECGIARTSLQRAVIPGRKAKDTAAKKGTAVKRKGLTLAAPSSSSSPDADLESIVSEIVAKVVREAAARVDKLEERLAEIETDAAFARSEQRHASLELAISLLQEKLDAVEVALAKRAEDRGDGLGVPLDEFAKKLRGIIDDQGMIAEGRLMYMAGYLDAVTAK